MKKRALPLSPKGTGVIKIISKNINTLPLERWKGQQLVAYLKNGQQIYNYSLLVRKIKE